MVYGINTQFHINDINDVRIFTYKTIYIFSVIYYMFIYIYVYVVVFIFWFTSICTPVYISSTVHRTTLKQSQKS